MKTLTILILITVLVLPILVTAKQGHMTLLAVTEVNNTYKGSTADLYLEILPGTGRVFLETFPLTKFDTQISTRFAKEIACSTVDIDCNKYDFFYTINANSPIIAGASAGASIASLTASMLLDYEINEEIAITGTINSGGLIGPVAGIKEKIDAAKVKSIDTVLIPKAGKIFLDENKTIDVKNFSKKLNINIIEVSTLAEVVEHFTGKQFQTNNNNLEINPMYTDTMKYLAGSLCDRARLLKNTSKNLKFNNTKSIENAYNLSIKGEQATNNSYYYSAASYCFGANVEYSFQILLGQELTEIDIQDKKEILLESVNKFESTIKKQKIETITDLEAYMVVIERLINAKDFLNKIKSNTTVDDETLYNLAYAIERLNSAKSWAKFLDSRGKAFNLNNDMLEQSCKSKLLEVEERFQYVNLYFPATLTNIRTELDYAYEDLEQENYALCIFKASKTKANLDIILNSLYTDEDQVKEAVRQKLNIVKKNIIKESEKGIFPILGYSYYEYANVLEPYDTFSALLYTEYALELSNLDVYFKEKKNPVQTFVEKIDQRQFSVLVLGILIGIIIGLLIKISYHKPSKKRVPAGKKR